MILKLIAIEIISDRNAELEANTLTQAYALLAALIGISAYPNEITLVKAAVKL